jgi:CHASE2 domain-containing sensor protein
VKIFLSILITIGVVLVIAGFIVGMLLLQKIWIWLPVVIFGVLIFSALFYCVYNIVKLKYKK